MGKMVSETTIKLSGERISKIKQIQEHLGMEYFKDAVNYIIDLGLGNIPSLSKELTEKLNKIFIDATPTEKLNIIIDTFLKWHEKFPYLTVQRKITPQDANFPSCPLVGVLYWKGEFLGFYCRARKPPLNLPRIKIGNISFPYVTEEDCWLCVELYKKQKLGIDPFRDISLEQVKLAKEEHKKLSRTEKEQIIMQKLEGKFRESTIEKAPKIFNYVTYDKQARRWNFRGVSKASKHLGLSRTTIYEILKEFPDGQIS
jgi:hypothetical protein